MHINSGLRQFKKIQMNFGVKRFLRREIVIGGTCAMLAGRARGSVEFDMLLLQVQLMF